MPTTQKSKLMAVVMKTAMGKRWFFSQPPKVSTGSECNEDELAAECHATDRMALQLLVVARNKEVVSLLKRQLQPVTKCHSKQGED